MPEPIRRPSRTSCRASSCAATRPICPTSPPRPRARCSSRTRREAYLNVIGGVGGPTQTDEGALNLHLGAKVPETGKKKLFFANPWGIAFTTQAGPGNAYVISAGSDLLVKLNVDADGP